MEHEGFELGVSAVRAATFGSVAETGRRWGHCTRQAGWGLNRQMHAVGDGADWIGLQSQEVFGAQSNFLCDFFHVSESLGAAAPSCRPAQPDQGCRTQQKRRRRGEVQKVMAALAGHLEADGTPEAEAPVRTGHRYRNHPLECLDYPRALALGWPSGSGMLESGHRQVLQARLEKAGAAWLPDHADQSAHLPVLRANDQSLSLWN